MKTTKIIPTMEKENETIQKTFITTESELNIVQNLLSDSWIKKSALVFQKPRNNYTIEINGQDHPLWTVRVIPKNDMFNEYDWKYKQDLKKLKNLGKPLDKRLYLNDNNKQEILDLLDTMIVNKLQLIYNENYILFYNNQRINIFKIAAKMNLTFQPDGLYAGQKKIF